MRYASAHGWAGDGEARRCLRLMVVDDHDLFRTGMRTLLEAEGHKVAGAASGGAALRLARSFRPDVVVMDVNMPDMSGIDATRMLMVEHPRLAVLMLTGDAEGVLDAVRAGACGYVLKDAGFDDILAGIEAAAAGHSMISPRVGPALLASVRAAAVPHMAVASGPPLSSRERSVLALMVDGYDNGEIAARLHLSPSTVKTHVSRLYEKLGVENRVQAATFAVRHSLVEHRAAA